MTRAAYIITVATALVIVLGIGWLILAPEDNLMSEPPPARPTEEVPTE